MTQSQLRVRLAASHPSPDWDYAACATANKAMMPTAGRGRVLKTQRMREGSKDCWKTDFDFNQSELCSMNL